MQLSNTFTVSIPVGEAWETLLDLERVAPCLPGAAITDVDGDGYHGGVKIKVGPITAQYRGVASYVERDESAYRAVISARGKDVRGQGNAEALIVATLRQHGSGTEVRVDTDLDLSGRVAQFGRGVISDVTGKLLTQFAKNLETEINAGRSKLGEQVHGEVASPASRGVAPGARPTLDDVEPLNVMGGVSGTLAKYGLPVLGVVTAVVLSLVVGRRRQTHRGPGSALYGPVNVYVMLESDSQAGAPA